MVAPGAERTRSLLGGALYGFEEPHVVRAARLRLDNNRLVQDIYVNPPQAEPSEQRVLAQNIAGVWFRFNLTTRTLQVSIAARGLHADPRFAAGGHPPGWPAGAPAVGDASRRILDGNRTWRIRN